MKHLLILISFLLLSSPVFGQSERPETIIIPVGTMGKITDSQKQIIQNTLGQELTKYFRLVPQDKFEEAQEKAFEELEFEECTEDQCIMMIQEILQVENVFKLQIVEEKGDTQLSLTWVGLDEKKIVTDYCKGCGTFELNTKIATLVNNLVNQIKSIKGLPTEYSVTESKGEVSSEVEEKKEEYTIKFRGIIGSGTTDIYEFRSNSLYFVWERWGIGFSDLSLKSSVWWRLKNRSLNLTYTYWEDLTLTLGIGTIIDGEAALNYSDVVSNEVSGYRFISFIGKNFGNWELLGGYQYSSFEYIISPGPSSGYVNTRANNELDSHSTVGLLVFGVEIGF